MLATVVEVNIYKAIVVFFSRTKKCYESGRKILIINTDGGKEIKKKCL